MGSLERQPSADTLGGCPTQQIRLAARVSAQMRPAKEADCVFVAVSRETGRGKPHREPMEGRTSRLDGPKDASQDVRRSQAKTQEETGRVE
jgi:hypothetical protein